MIQTVEMFGTVIKSLKMGEVSFLFAVFLCSTVVRLPLLRQMFWKKKKTQKKQKQTAMWMFAEDTFNV